MTTSKQMKQPIGEVHEIGTQVTPVNHRLRLKPTRREDVSFMTINEYLKVTLAHRLAINNFHVVDG